MDRADFLKLLGLGAAAKIAEAVVPSKLVAAEPPPVKPEPAPIHYLEQTFLSVDTTLRSTSTGYWRHPRMADWLW